MSVWSDLFSLKGLVSLAITTPLAIGALAKLSVRAAHVDVRRDSPSVRGTSHTVVTGGVRGSTVIGGRGHVVSITHVPQRLEAALRPGEVIALGFWGWVCLFAIMLAILFVPYVAEIAVTSEALASFVLPVIALSAVFSLQKSGERIGGAMAYFVFASLISWMVLRNYDGATAPPSFGGFGFLPKYAPSFRASFDALVQNRRDDGTELVNAIIVGSSAFGFAALVVLYAKIGLAYLAGDNGFTHAVQNGLMSLVAAFFHILLVSGVMLAVWKWVHPQFIWSIIVQTLPFI